MRKTAARQSDRDDCGPGSGQQVAQRLAEERAEHDVHGFEGPCGGGSVAVGQGGVGDERDEQRPAQQPDHLNGGSGYTGPDAPAHERRVVGPADGDRDGGQEECPDRQDPEPGHDRGLVRPEQREHLGRRTTENVRVIECRRQSGECGIGADDGGDEQECGGYARACLHVHDGKTDQRFQSRAVLTFYCIVLQLVISRG